MAQYLTSRANFVFEFEVGMDKYGKPMKKRITLSGVRPDITADEAKQVITALTGLVKHTLMNFERVVYEGIAQ